MSNLPGLRARTVTCTVSGTPVQGPTLAVPEGIEVVVKAAAGNTGTVTVAESSANALNSDADNFPLEPGTALTIQVQNTSMLWFDSTVSGDTVRLVFEYNQEF